MEPPDLLSGLGLPLGLDVDAAASGLVARASLDLGLRCSAAQPVEAPLPGPSGGGLSLSPGLITVVAVCVLFFVAVFVGITWAVARSRTSIGKILRLAIPERSVLVWATLAMLLNTVCTMPLMYTFGQFINVITEHLKDGDSGSLPMDKLTPMLVFVVCSMVGGTILGAVSTFLFSLAGERITRRLRADFFRALLVQDMAFFDLHQSGEWLNRLAADAGTVQQAASSNLSMFLNACGRFVAGVLICLATSWKLFLVIFVVIPIMMCLAISMGRMMRRLSKQYQNSLASAGGIAGETFGSIRTIRTFSNGEARQLSKYVEELDAAFLVGRRRARVGALLTVSVGLLVQIALMGSLVLGGILVVKGLNHQQGGMQAGTLTSFLMYALYAASAVGQLIGLYNSMTQAIGASTRVFEVVERQPAIPSTLCEDAAQLLAPTLCEGAVEFEGVSFSYSTPARSSGGEVQAAALAPPVVTRWGGGSRRGGAREPLAAVEEVPLELQVEVLRDMTFQVKPGWVVALVGPSGGGKSTVMALIMRFYDPRKGTVRLDGHDLRTLDPRWLRRQMGIVTQEPVLFSTTIRDNITYSMEGQVSDADVEAVARKANAHDFISKIPNGYGANCGERGVRLSGGEKQRIAIARALLPRPRLLLMDEATSALDAESERLVQEAMDLLLHEDKERPTVMMIAHRLATVRSAQMILVIREGQIVERGTHEELMGGDGLYSKLAMHQHLG